MVKPEKQILSKYPFFSGIGISPLDATETVVAYYGFVVLLPFPTRER